MKYSPWLTCAGLALASFFACSDYEPPAKHHVSPRGGASGASAGGSVGAAGALAGGPAATAGEAGAAGAEDTANGPKTVLIVLEGLRPEQVSALKTPQLWDIAQHGVLFSNYFGVLPSNRMAAAATLASGALPAHHGILGARMYLPGAVANDSAGQVVDSQQPISLEDQGTLETLQQSSAGGLLKSKTIVQVARGAGLQTAVIGRSGPASLFDLGRSGWLLDDDYVWPRAFADLLVDMGVGLPNHVSTLFPDLNGPSGYVPVADADAFGMLAPMVVTFQAPPAWSPIPKFNQAYLNPTLPSSRTYGPTRKLEFAVATRVLADPASNLLVFWVRDPGETALRNGPGSPAAANVMTEVDAQLGQLAASLPAGSNLVITSDGGASALAGDSRFFPRWAVGKNGTAASFWVQTNSAGGVPVDGAVRLVDILGRAGFLAYDGESCLSGHAYTVYPALKSDPTWPPACWSATFNPKGGELTGPATVPTMLDPNAVIVASNGSGELLYLPGHRASEMTKLVQFLESRPEVGALFLASRYGSLPGTLDLGLLGFERNAPVDLFLTYAWDAADAVSSAPLVNLTPALDLVTPMMVVGSPLNASCAPGCDPTTGSCSKVCRDGLICDVGAPPAGACRFCPVDRDLTDPDCALSTRVDPATANANSKYQAAGGFCESSRLCDRGLSCLYGICQKTGTKVTPAPVTIPADFLRGSSYGAMSGVVLTSSPFDNSLRLLQDHHGVRGGAAPAELHGVLIASGPAFKRGVVTDLPAGLADVAPTLLHVLQSGLESKLGSSDGRLLTEALVETHTPTTTLAACASDRLVTGQKYCALSSSATQGPSYSPTSPDTTAQTLLSVTGSYSSRLLGYTVQQGNTQYSYWTQAGAARSALGCQHDADCPAGVPCGALGVCLVTPNCSDGVKDGSETDVDCGSEAKCLPCARGSSCAVGLDCETNPNALFGVVANACNEHHVCVDLQCTDGIQNGVESGTDCGRQSGCGLCPAGEGCAAPTDCQSSLCSDETCD